MKHEMNRSVPCRDDVNEGKCRAMTRGIVVGRWLKLYTFCGWSEVTSARSDGLRGDVKQLQRMAWATDLRVDSRGVS